MLTCKNLLVSLTIARICSPGPSSHQAYFVMRHSNCVMVPTANASIRVPLLPKKVSK